MRTRSIFALFLFFFLMDLSAQEEQIISKGRYSMAYDADIMGNRLLFGINAYTYFGVNASVWPWHGTLYATDLDLNILDSLNFDQYFGFATGSYVGAVKNYKDSIALVAVGDADANPAIHSNYILYMDTSLEVLDTILIRAERDTQLINVNHHIMDSVLITVNQQRGLNDPLAYANIGVYDLGTGAEIDSFNFKADTDGAFRNMTFFNNKYICTPNYIVPYPFVTLNADFSYDRVYGRKDFNPWLFYRIDNFLCSDDRHLYTAGYFSSDFVAMIKFNKNLEVVRMDTAYVPDRTHEQRGCVDYVSLDNIFIGVGQNANVEGSQFIHIFNMDTTGNFNWHTTIFQDSSIRFILYEVVASPDGGAFIISSKYDPNYMTDEHYRVSIMKIDSTGQVIAEREFRAPKAFDIYPNPAKDVVQVEGLPKSRLFTAVVLDINGREVLRKELDGERKLDVSGLASGTYLLQVHTGQGFVGSGKLVVE